jgi:hypothetical protein
MGDIWNDVVGSAEVVGGAALIAARVPEDATIVGSLPDLLRTPRVSDWPWTGPVELSREVTATATSFAEADTAFTDTTGIYRRKPGSVPTGAVRRCNSADGRANCAERQDCKADAAGYADNGPGGRAGEELLPASNEQM